MRTPTESSASVRLPSPVACPTCGHVSDDIRCPRCFALKLAACSGACRKCPASTGCGDAGR